MLKAVENNGKNSTYQLTVEPRKQLFQRMLSQVLGLRKERPAGEVCSMR